MVTPAIGGIGSAAEQSPCPTGMIGGGSRVRESICIFCRWQKIMVATSVCTGCSNMPPACCERIVRFPYRPKKDTPGGGVLFWSRVRESNPPSRLGKPLYYRYTNPAWRHYINCHLKKQAHFDRYGGVRKGGSRPSPTYSECNRRFAFCTLHFALPIIHCPLSIV